MLGRIVYHNLKAFCELDWLLNIFETSANYRTAIVRLGNIFTVMKQIVVSAEAMLNQCILRHSYFTLLSAEDLFDALVYGLGKSTGRNLWYIKVILFGGLYELETLVLKRKQRKLKNLKRKKPRIKLWQK